MITRCSLIIRDVQARAVWFADVDSGLAGSHPLRRAPPLRGSRLFPELTQRSRAGLIYAAAPRTGKNPCYRDGRRSTAPNGPRPNP
jgi:hypothetical protein